MQTSPSKWRFECTGKISGNGEYEIAFIQTGGQNVLKLGNLSLLKRDEKLAEISINRSSQCGNPILGSLKVDAFEAGTPFYIEVEANGINGNDTRGLVFIRKK